MRTIKIFLGSSITELHDERLLLGDYLLNSVRPIFKRDGVDIEVVKCEDIRTGYRGKSSQEEINDLLRGCDISVFMFKTKAGPQTVREYNVAQELAGTKNHEIYVYCFGVIDEEKEESLKSFKQQMRDIELYWKTCKDVTDLESQFVIGLLDFERQLLGKTKLSALEQESETEKDGDTLFADFMQDEGKRTQRIEKIHQNIEDLLQQTKTVMDNEDETIAARIFKVIELYKKADQWATATAYDKDKYSDLLFDYARFLYDYGLYKDAEAIYLRQIAIGEELYGKEHEKTAKSYNNLSSVYWRQSNFEKALEYDFKALAIQEKIFGTEHSDTARTYNDLGTVYNDRGDYDKALEYYFTALAIREKVLGTEHPDTAISYNNIGTIYNDKGDYDNALEYYFKALAIVEKNFGQEHIYTATSYNNIGGVYKVRGDYGKALQYHQKALAIKEKVLGTEHPTLATSYNNIGLLYDDKGDYGKALEYYFKALAIVEKYLGQEHPSTAISYTNIGLLYFNKENLEKALEFLNKAYQIDEKVLGSEHPSTKKVLEYILLVKTASKSNN